MKRIAILLITVAMVVALVFGVSTAMAAKPSKQGGGKPPDRILMSNGFPSGPHHNLIFHGKNESFECISPSPGGGSVFIPLWTTDLNEEADGHVTIQYIQNKSKGATELRVLDSCAIDDGLAVVQLPSKVMLDDGSTQPTDGYWVYAKITGTPGKETENKIILWPNRIIEACNDPGVDLNPGFPEQISCEGEGVALGMIYGDDIWIPVQNGEASDVVFERFEPDPLPGIKGKGRSIAANITALFEYTGWVVDERLDTYSDDGAGTCTPGADGNISICDVPLADYDPDTSKNDLTRDYNNDGVEDDDDIEAWLKAQSLLDPPMAWYFENVFMHEIADLVVTEQGLENQGARTLQVRFYPRSTTVFP